MAPNRAAGEVSAHVAEFCDRNQIQDIELARHAASTRARRKINDLCDEVKKPKHIKQAEQGVRHRSQRFGMAQARKHLARENRKQKKEQYRDFEVVGTGRPNLGEVIKTAAEHDGAADHSCNLEIRQTFVIEHLVKFQEPDQSEDADQKPE